MIAGQIPDARFEVSWLSLSLIPRKTNVCRFGLYLRLFCCLNATLLLNNNTITSLMRDCVIECDRGLCHAHQCVPISFRTAV